MGKASAKIQDMSTKAVGAIGLATGALTWGIRHATAEAKKSPLMEPTQKPVTVNPKVKEAASKGREASKSILMVSGQAMDRVAGMAGKMAGNATTNVSRAAPRGGSGKSSAWVKDAQYVGGSSVHAAITVFLALNGAADQLVQESLGSTADLVGHKFGEEAGATSREGFHVVGNVMSAKSLLSTKAVAKTVGKKAAKEAAGAASEAWAKEHGSVSSSPALAPTPAGIRLGPQ